jgi:hypothetical protein
MPPPRDRDFHDVPKSDQPVLRTLFAMLVRASFDGLTLPTAMNPYCLLHKFRRLLVEKILPPVANFGVDRLHTFAAPPVD